MFKKQETTGFIPEQPKKAKKEEKVVTSKKPAKPANKKPNIFVRMGLKFKEVFAELKRVTWPKWNKVVKNTGVVLAIVIVFLVFITLYDFGLAELFKLLQGI